MKYDCNKTLDYQHELDRMCATFEGCSSCPLGCICDDVMSQKRIDIVQSWSDEHTEETMSEHFKKLFPNAPYYPDNTPRACPRNLGWIEDKSCVGMSCKECWSKPYKENVSE